VAVRASGTTKSPPGGWAEKSATIASRSQAKELLKVSRHISEDTVPDDRGDPIMDELLNWVPVKNAPHVVGKYGQT